MSERVHNVQLLSLPEMGITAMELTSNHSFPRHSHDEYGIGVVLAGAQRSWSGIGMVESIPGDVITVNPGELHDGKPIDGAIRRWRIIYLDPTDLLGILRADGGNEVEFVSPSIRDHRLSSVVSKLFDRLTDGSEQLGIEELVIHAVNCLSRPTPRGNPEPGSCASPVLKAQALIDDDPARAITLLELAAISGLNRYEVVRAFSRELGITPYAYVIQRRVLLARDILLQGETLASAAQVAGFSDQSHMTRCFSRQFGVSPGRFVQSRI
ncbi:MAG: AraC family transcriptional regulator [Pseudomonadota bacterium]